MEIVRASALCLTVIGLGLFSMTGCLHNSVEEDPPPSQQKIIESNPVYLDELAEEVIQLPPQAYADTIRDSHWRDVKMSPSGKWIYFLDKSNPANPVLSLFHRESGKTYTAYVNETPDLYIVQWLYWIGNDKIQFTTSLKGGRTLRFHHLLDVSHITQGYSESYQTNVIDLVLPQWAGETGISPLVSPSGKWAHVNTRGCRIEQAHDSLFVLNLETLEITPAFAAPCDSNVVWTLTEFAPWIGDEKIVIGKEISTEPGLELYILDVSHITSGNSNSATLIAEEDLLPIWTPPENSPRLFHQYSFSPSGKWYRFITGYPEVLVLVRVGTEGVTHNVPFTEAMPGPDWAHPWVDDTQIFFTRIFNTADEFRESYHLLNVSFITGQ